MSVPASANPLLLRSAAPTSYQISRSLRFNSADSAYLSRTPASAGNRKTWTWAGWVKLSKSTDIGLFSAGPGTGDWSVWRIESDKIDFLDAGATNFKLTTSRVFRDHSAWYHIVLAWDTTQATAANRIKLYINGAQETVFSSSAYPALNYDGRINSANPHSIGREEARAASYFSGYLADIHFIDGQALAPTSFGEFDANGIWQPKAYSGSYGTNGFRLPFSDNSAATATTLGKDSAGSNNWTPTNLSVTAGSGNDSLVDSPTSYGTDTGAGGEVRGNCCTLNPLSLGANVALSNGNLDVTLSSTNAGARGTISLPSGKWYFEGVVGGTGTNVMFGICNNTFTQYYFYSTSGGKIDSAGQTTYGASNTTGDVLGVAFDNTSGTITFYKNGASQGVAFTGISATDTWFPCWYSNVAVSTAWSANFGQRPFAYTAPSGFKALNTANLPAPVVTKPSDVMDVLLWSGTGGNRSLTGLGMSPDFVWIKQRNQAFSVGHQLYDIVRGAGSLKQLDSSNTTAEGGGNTNQYGYLSSFDSSGFSVTAGSIDSDYVNKSGTTYVAWAWDAGSSTVTNTSGSISSQVRANASAGFSIVTFTTPASGVYTCGHGLGVTPSMVIIKDRSTGSTNWCVYHSGINPGTSNYLVLNVTNATLTAAGIWGSGITSSVISSTANVGINPNSSGLAYCFAPVSGYSAFGSYTGNGSADGPFVYTGFRPRWIIMKSSNNTYNWQLFDTARDPYNVAVRSIYPNLSNAEDDYTSLTPVDILSNGFKLRTTSIWNTSATTYVWAAFAENPFALARAR